MWPVFRLVHSGEFSEIPGAKSKMFPETLRKIALVFKAALM